MRFVQPLLSVGCLNDVITVFKHGAQQGAYLCIVIYHQQRGSGTLGSGHCCFFTLGPFGIKRHRFVVLTRFCDILDVEYLIHQSSQLGQVAVHHLNHLTTFSLNVFIGIQFLGRA